MLDHISIAVADIEASRAFYDAAMAPLGVTRLMNIARGDVSLCGFGRDGKPSFWLVYKAGRVPKIMTGHIAFAAQDRNAVRAFYDAALAAGAADDGAPGLRPQYHENYCASFVVDPGGNRLEAVCHEPE